MPGMTEDGIIRTFRKTLGLAGAPHEDVEVLPPAAGRTVAAVDTMVQGTDIPPGMGLSDAARKSVAAVVSDFAAKGVRPTHGIISVTLPGGTTPKDVRDIAAGMRRACREFGIKIAGGDTGTGREIVLSVCLIGCAERTVPRGGARAGDDICVTGPFGYTPIGLEILMRDGTPADTLEKKAVSAVLRPKPPLEFCLGNAARFTSATDSSDGLGAALRSLASQSKKRFVIDDLPADGAVIGRAARWEDALGMIFGGGEEYETVFTIPPEMGQEAWESGRGFGVPVIRIGHVEEGSGAYLRQDGGPDRRIDWAGWKHAV